LAIYVVDQNEMRGERLRTIVRSEPLSRFVIPDVAFEEMIKHERWEDTMRRSLVVFVPILDRVFCSVPIGEAIRQEMARREPVSMHDLIPNDISDGMRGMIGAIVEGGEGAKEWRFHIRDERDAVRAERCDPLALRSALQAGIARIAKHYGRKLVSDQHAQRPTRHTSSSGIAEGRR